MGFAHQDCVRVFWCGQWVNASVAISLSTGWGVRGNFGHEYGAMLPGVLAALAACILPGREDWRVRAPHFAFFGALGKGQLLYIVFLWC